MLFFAEDNADVRIQDLGPPEKIISGFNPEIYGGPLNVRELNRSPLQHAPVVCTWVNTAFHGDDAIYNTHLQAKPCLKQRAAYNSHLHYA